VQPVANKRSRPRVCPMGASGWPSVRHALEDRLFGRPAAAADGRAVVSADPTGRD
jgi:hypothetical protein